VRFALSCSVSFDILLQNLRVGFWILCSVHLDKSLANHFNLLMMSLSSALNLMSWRLH